MCDTDYFRTTHGSCSRCSNHYFLVLCIAGAILVLITFIIIPVMWVARVVLKRSGRDATVKKISPTRLLVAIYCFIYGIKRGNYSLNDADTRLAIEVTVTAQVISFLNRIVPKFKISLAMFQIVALFPFVLAIRYDSTDGAYARHLNRISHFTNLNHGLSLECYNSFDFVDLLILSACVPIVAAILLLNISILHQLHIINCYPALRKLPVVLQKLRDEYWWLLLQGVAVVSPCVLTLAFGSFSCHDIDPLKQDDSIKVDSYLRADYSITCNSHRHRLAKYIGIAVVVAYGIGVPLLYMHVLQGRHTYAKSPFILTQLPSSGSGMIDQTKSELAVSALKRGRFLSGVNSLCGAYKPEFW